MHGSKLDPIAISTLKPSESELDNIKQESILEELDTCTFVDFLQALDDNDSLDPDRTGILCDMIKSVAFKPAGDVMLTHAAISIMLVKAFEKYIERFALNRVHAALDRYADAKADELAERGIHIDYSV